MALEWLKRVRGLYLPRNKANEISLVSSSLGIYDLAYIVAEYTYRVDIMFLEDELMQTAPNERREITKQFPNMPFLDIEEWIEQLFQQSGARYFTLEMFYRTLDPLDCNRLSCWFETRCICTRPIFDEELDSE